MKFFVLLFFCLVLHGSLFAQKQNFNVIAYYAGNAKQIDPYEVESLTHIIFCFSHLKGNQLHLGGAESVATVKKLVGLKSRNPKLKVLLSLGGWGGCKTCSDVFSQADDRLAFAESVKRLLVRYEADGIDLDWEYPAVEGPPGHPYKPEDKQNFTALLRELRQTLGSRYIISFAAGGFEDYMKDAIEWQEVAPLIDFVNLMSYDLVNGYSKVTGHHTPLYSTPEQLLSVDYGVREMISRGMPAGKIIIGLAFYGRIWENVPSVNNGIYQPGNFRKSESIKRIDGFLRDKEYKFYWDSTAKAPYIYNEPKKLFITYDNDRSVSLKTRYALEEGLGGVMFWQLRLDYTREGLLEEIMETIQSYRQEK